MNKPALVALAAQFAPRFLQIRLGTWIAIGLGLLTVFVLLIWAAIALIGWFLGQAQGLAGKAPDVARGAIAQVEQIAPGVREQIEQAVPGVRDQLGQWVPALKPEPPPRDVSGTDVGPVPRYSGLARSHWHRDGREITVRYEGAADYAAVLDHYVKGFAAQGYAQNVLSATPEGEKHEYRKDADRVVFMLAQLPKGKVKATLVAVLP